MHGRHDEEGSYRFVAIHEVDVREFLEGGRGDGRRRIVPEGRGRFEGGRRE
jgi:hypothetical protein